MIIIQTEGGLGNQMFQYALALAFEKKGRVVKMDISRYDDQPGHNGYELQKVFGINALYSSAGERAVLKRISKLRHVLFNSPYKEKPGWQWQFHPEVLSVRAGFLKGYWQSEKYFAAAEKKVRDTFKFPPLTDQMNTAVQHQINNCNAVSVHIRRGDYLHSDINCSLPLSFYREAIALMSSKVNNPFYFIFSDDIEWAKQHIQEKNITFIGWNKGSNSYADMQLMSLCRHHIVANSSFSWWGAWLNSNAHKIVIAPSPWMPSHTAGKDIIPANWIQLPAAFANTAST